MTGANIITRMTGFLYRIFISRFIGAEGLGLFALVMPVYSVCCAVVASGIPVAAMKKIPEAETASLKKSVTRSALFLVLDVSLVLFCLLLFFARPLSRFLGDERTYPSLIILSFAVLITGFENVYKSSFYSDRCVKIPAVTEISEQLLRTLSVVLLLVFFSKGDITLSAAVLTFGIFIGELLSLFMLTGAYKKHTAGIKAGHIGPVRSGIFNIALPVTLSKTAESILSSASNILIPFLLTKNGLTRAEATGVLGVISGMIMPLLYMPCVFTNAVTVNLVPFISENLKKNNRGAVIRKCEKVLLITSLFAFPCTFAMVVFRNFFACVLFSDSRVALFLPIMASGGLAATFRHILNSVMNASGREKKASLYAFSSNIAELLLTVALTPFLGVFGYIAAYALSNMVFLIPSFITAADGVGLSLPSAFRSSSPAVPALLSFAAGRFLYLSIIPSLGITLSSAISFFSALILYSFAVYFLYLKKKIIFFSKIT